MSEPPFRPPDPTDVDPAAVKRAFGRAARTYDGAAALQREVAARMMARLDVVRLTPRRILDLGCGTGEGTLELAARYPGASVVGLDLALPMAMAARERARRGRSLYRRLVAPLLGGADAEPRFVCAEATRLPLEGVSFDLAWSNLTLQWVNDLPRAFAELRRVLRTGSLLTFTTFGPDTLKELRAAFAGVDDAPHVGRFVDMHDVGDLLVHAGFADPVMHMEHLTLTYADPLAMMRDLKAIGAANAAQGRARGLMGKRRLARVVAALEAMRRDGRIPATFEVVYGHAWKAAPRTTPEGDAIVRFERPGRRGGA